MHKKKIIKEKGSAVFFTMILVLAMMVLVVGAIKMVSTQSEIYNMEKRFNDTYYLGCSAVEKASDYITKYVEANSTVILETVNTRIKDAIFDPSITKYNALDYEKPDGVNRINLDDKLHEYYFRRVTFEKVNEYLKQDPANPLKFNLPKEIYTAKSDNMPQNTQVTIEKITPTVVETEGNDGKDEKGKDCQSVSHNDEKCICYWYKLKNLAMQSSLTPEQQKLYDRWMNQGLFVINTKAVMKNKSNKDIVVEKIQGDMNLTRIKLQRENEGDREVELLERYKWVNNPPEILNSAVLSFSDFVVQNDAKVTIEGDLVVKGSNQPRNKLVAPDENGGVIVANKSMLNVIKPDTTKTKSKNTGSVYTMNNVGVTNGWEENPVDVTNTIAVQAYKDKLRLKTTINVVGDIVANTVAVMDDFYLAAEDKTGANGIAYNSNMQVMHASIQAGGNVFVDNDVLIERYVQGAQTAEPYIKVIGAIFGISDGEMTKGPSTGKGLDPNKSSGVFNLSQPNSDGGQISQIEAGGMYVNGHPYVSFDSMKTFHRLHESIGGPMDDVYSFEAAGETVLYPYTREDKSTGGSSGYLKQSPYKDKIKLDKIKIADSKKMYAPGAIAANGKLYIENGATVDHKPNLPYFINSAYVFYKSISSKISDFKFETLTNVLPLGGVYTEIMKDPKDYYSGKLGTKSNLEHSKVYYDGTIDSTDHYQGIQGFMTAARGVFYNKVLEGTDKEPIIYNFDDKAGSGLTSESLRKAVCIKNKKWSYNKPIDIRTASELTVIDISKYYDEEGPVPTIVVIDGIEDENSVVEIKTTDNTKNKFRGVIVSKRNLEIRSNLVIEGSVIVGGTNGDGKPIERPKVIRGEHAGILITGSNANVTFIHNPNAILEVQSGDRQLIRDILDMLKITDYPVALNVPPVPPASPVPYKELNLAFKNNKYTAEQIMISDKSILDMKGSSLVGRIISMKKDWTGGGE